MNLDEAQKRKVAAWIAEGLKVSEIQKRRNLPESAQRVPPRRVAGWLLVAGAIASGVYLYFRFAGGLPALLN